MTSIWLCCIVLPNCVDLEVPWRSPVVLHLFHLRFAERTSRMLLEPLYQAYEVETQVITWCGDGSFFDRFQADGAIFGLDMAALALAGGAFDAEVVWRC